MGIPRGQVRDKSQGFADKRQETLRFLILSEPELRLLVRYIPENHSRPARRDHEDGEQSPQAFDVGFDWTSPWFQGVLPSDRRARRITASEAGLAVDLRHEGLRAIAALMAPAKPEVA